MLITYDSCDIAYDMIIEEPQREYDCSYETQEFEFDAAIEETPMTFDDENEFTFEWDSETSTDAYLHIPFEDFCENTKKLQATTSKNRKGNVFITIIEEIAKYCIHNGKMDLRKCARCGFIPLTDDIYAVSPKHLRKLVDREISGINKTLKQIGFQTVNSRADKNNLIRSALSFKPDSELRFWSIRVCHNQALNETFKYVQKIAAKSNN